MGFFFFFFPPKGTIFQRVQEKWGRLEEPRPSFVLRVSSPVNHGVLHRAVAAPPDLSLGIGGAAEHFMHRLNDGVAVDAKDPEQLVRLAAARDLGDRQAVHGEAGLVHHG